MINNALVETTKAICAERYPEAKVIFLSGSVVRGEHTPTSDLDLVIIYQRLENAYRESFRFDNWPVEAFVHDPETLNYFFQMDRDSGVPSLPNMVNEGIEVPEASDFSHAMKELAKAVLAEGPPHWEKLEIDNSRYAITDILDDLHAPRSRVEQIASATVLFSQLINHFLRSRQVWSAKGKTIPRRLREVDSEFAVRFEESFQTLFTTGHAAPVIALAEDVLERDGGRLFEGHKLAAPTDWRQKL